MKSSYELAMERLSKNAPAQKLTVAQKKQLAELDSKYTAKIAEREIALKGEIAKVADDFEKAEALQKQLTGERKKTSGRTGGEEGTNPFCKINLSGLPSRSS
jgi:hypothetical protein